MMKAPCSPKRRHYLALFKLGIEIWDEYEYWLEKDVEGCSSSLLWITLQAFSLQRMSKSTKRRAFGQKVEVSIRNLRVMTGVRRPRPTYAISSESPVSTKTPVLPFRGTLSDLRKDCDPQNFTNPDFQVCRNSTHDPSNGAIWCYLLIWYTCVYCESYSCVLRN